ncbi:MAG TPA: transcriptional repressor [Candidatus Acidoferrum sp.]|nr:transcriptional repressor [Candidatus Acidoferrum sp.]
MPTTSAPVRDTRQKRAIRRVLDRADRPLTPEEILAGAARESEGLGIATVYRTLKGLVEEGWLNVVEVPGRPGLYERSGKEHHHHFVCERCEKVFELKGCTVTADLPRGFRARDHDVTIYGTCAPCSPSKRSARR